MSRLFLILALAPAIGQSVKGPVFEAASLKRVVEDYISVDLPGGPGTLSPTRARMHSSVHRLLWKLFWLQSFATALDSQTLPDSQQAAIVERVQQKATQYVGDLPNFVCTQETLRERDSSGSGEKWKKIDDIVEQLNFFDHRENYEIVSINGKLSAKKSHETLKNFRSSGEFGSVLSTIFRPQSKAEFHWERREALGARPVDVIAYHVAQNLSQSRVTFGSRRVIVGHHGWVYADIETGSVLRLVTVSEMPVNFPVRGVTNEIDYSPFEIAGKTYLLTSKSRLVVQFDKVRERNTIVFSGYRKFDAETKIQFDGSDAVKKQP